MRSYKIQWAVRPGFMSSSSELFQKGNLIPVIFLPQFGEPIALRANCLHLARCLAWPPCRVQTVLELALLPGAATCRVRDKPLPPASSLLGVSATWFPGLPRAVLRLLCDERNLMCAACLPLPGSRPDQSFSLGSSALRVLMSSTPGCTAILPLLKKPVCPGAHCPLSFLITFPPEILLDLWHRDGTCAWFPELCQFPRLAVLIWLC